MRPRIEITVYGGSMERLLHDLNQRRDRGDYDAFGPTWTVMLPLAVYTNPEMGSSRTIYTFALGKVGEKPEEFKKRFELFSSQSQLLCHGAIAFRLEIPVEVPTGNETAQGYGILTLEKERPELKELIKEEGLRLLKRELGRPITVDPGFNLEKIRDLPTTVPLGLSA